MSSLIPPPAGTDVLLLGTPEPGEARLRSHIASARMLAAADDGRFGVMSTSFPVVIAWVDVGGKPFGLRLECSDYPGQAPAGAPWDLVANRGLPACQWPIDGRTPAVFRPEWSPSNGNAPYLACDRVGLATHPGWTHEVPHLAWTSARTLYDYLEQVHTALVGSVLPSPEER